MVRLPWPWGFLVGWCSIADGLIAVLTLGFCIGTFRHKASLAGARAAYNARIKWDNLQEKQS